MSTRRRRDEAGGVVSVWALITAAAFIALLGIADINGQLAQERRAHDIATQAARAGGQVVDKAVAVQGDGAYVEPAAAAAAARGQLRAFGVSGSATVHGDHLTVQVTESYQTRFLGIIGIGSLPVRATSTARLVRAVEGAEQ